MPLFVCCRSEAIENNVEKVPCRLHAYKHVPCSSLSPSLPVLQWKEKAQAAEAEVQKLQSQLAHMEHASRAQELTLEQLKGRLSDKVTREERFARRDAEAYARLKKAFLSTKGGGSCLYWCLVVREYVENCYGL